MLGVYKDFFVPLHIYNLNPVYLPTKTSPDAIEINIIKAFDKLIWTATGSKLYSMFVRVVSMTG